jgi:hypothetical protein
MRALAAVLGVIALPTFAADWTHIGEDLEKNSWMVDRASITREGDLVRAWKMTLFAVPKPLPATGTLISWMVFLDVTNCAKRVVGVKASKLFATGGAVLAAHEDPDDRIQWQSAAAGTVIEKSMQLVCEASRSKDAR